MAVILPRTLYLKSMRETGFIARNRNSKTDCHLAARKQPFKLFQETLYTGDTRLSKNWAYWHVWLSQHYAA